MDGNPFTTHIYRGPEFFCDRNTELSHLIDLFDNHRFGLLYSMRRLGKTGLLHHFHHTLRKRKNTICIYCDVQNTRNDGEFVSKLITAVLSEIEGTQQAIIRKAGQFFSSLRPVVTFDPVTQAPQLQLDIQSGKETEISLRILMDMLGEMSGKRFQIALDEFQQISSYSESRIDATLRGYLDKAPNVHFLFCGSRQHILLGLFSDARRPFFGTVEHRQLGYLDRQIYKDFIASHFTSAGQQIDNQSLEAILDWTRVHTFYTQYFCNRLFSKGIKDIGIYDVEHEKHAILFSFEPSYFNLESVLSKNQFKLLEAIAKEGEVSGVSASEFLNKYGMAQSTAQQAYKVLLEKELLYEQRTANGRQIFVYDPFFARWLERR
jgi:AAA+ ATPase superfamily predicted ATPase